MDPVTALGIASNVIQFVEFAGKLISRSSRYYRSADGSDLEYTEIVAAASNLEKLAGTVQKSTVNAASRINKVDVAQQGLLDASRQCQRIAQEMTDVLSTLMKPGQQNRWNSIRQAFRAIWSEEKIDKLSVRLSHAREQLVLYLLFEWR